MTITEAGNRRCGRAARVSPEAFALVGQLEDALDSAGKLAQALDLIGLGMTALGLDDGPTIYGVAEVLVASLQTAESARAQLRSAPRSRPRVIPSNPKEVTMPIDEQARANQSDASARTSATAPLPTSARAAGLYHTICAIDASIDAAMSFAMAVDLIGFGLRSQNSEYSAATLAVAEALQRHLREAKAHCDAILGKDDPADAAGLGNQTLRPNA